VTEPQLTAREALDRLAHGNARFAANVRSIDAMLSHRHRADLVGGQRPFAIILGCSDSRVPAETVFDSGLGDLFVIRVAGNVVAPSQIGSVEFAASRFGTRLVVVMGHSSCGAVEAALESLSGGAGPETSNLRSIVDRVRPAIEPLLGDGTERDAATMMREAVRANVLASVRQIRQGSALIENLIQHQGLAVVGAEYCLETGNVEFLTDLS